LTDGGTNDWMECWWFHGDNGFGDGPADQHGEMAALVEQMRAAAGIWSGWVCIGFGSSGEVSRAHSHRGRASD
jgi:hypothetical protein